MAEDKVDVDTMVGMLRKAARIVERAAKHPEMGSQELWDISVDINEAARLIGEYIDDVNGGCELPIDEEGRCEARHWVTNPGTRPVGTRCGAYVNPLTKGVEQSAQTLHTPSTTEEQKPRRGMPTPIKRRG